MEVDEFMCARCLGVFKKTLTEEECQEQYQKEFGEFADDDKAIICDSCFEKFKKWAKTAHPELPLTQ